MAVVAVVRGEDQPAEPSVLRVRDRVLGAVVEATELLHGHVGEVAEEVVEAVVEVEGS